MAEVQIVTYDGDTVEAEQRTSKVTVYDGGAGLPGAKGDPGDPGAPGQSAYEIAVDNGFAGTELEWLDSLQGVDGDDGESAYEIAAANGFVGTEADWLASLVGAAGQDGADGAPGEDGTNGRSPEFQKSATHIQWRLVGDTTWLNLVALADLKGDKGDPGADGIDGQDGVDRFLVESGGTYPARPDAEPVIFVGATNPDTLGLMTVGDTWVNTAEADPVDVVTAAGLDAAVAAEVEDDASQTREVLSASFAAMVPESALDTTLANLPAWNAGDPLRVVTVKPGDYTRTAAINVPSGVVLNLHGCKFTLAAGANSDVVSVTDAAHVYIQGGHLDGNVSNQTNVSSPNPGQSGVTIMNSTHVTVRDMFAENNLRHGFDVTGSSYEDWVPGEDTGHILIENCRARAFGDDGFTTHFCHDVIIRNCWGYESGVGGLGTNSNGIELDDGSEKIIVDGCITFGNESCGIYVKTHSGRPFHQGFQIANCRSFGNANHGISLANEDEDTVALNDFTITNCTTEDNGIDGLRLWGEQNVTVTGFLSRGDAYGVRVVGLADGSGVPLARNITVSDFQIIDATNSAIYLPETSTSRGVTFADGLIRGVVNHHAAYVGQSDVTLRGVRTVGGGLAPIRVLTGVNRLVVEGCEIREATTSGIVLEGNASHITIRGNIFPSPVTTTRPAVEFLASTTGTYYRIEGNKANGWQRGVYIFQSVISNVVIRDNDFASSATAGISNTGTVTGEFIVTGNVGYPTEKFGTGTIPDGASSVNVTHGLGGSIARQPTAVLLTKRTSEDIWVSARSTTTFTVTRTGTTGALAFDWQALYQS